jgi:hypothetical protein
VTLHLADPASLVVVWAAVSVAALAVTAWMVGDVLRWPPAG